MNGLRVLVCGGRDYNDRVTLFDTLDRIVLDRGPIDVLIHGNQRGADALAENWARTRGVAFIPVPANWQTHGKAAGPVRNRKMITEHAPDLVVAFPRQDGSIGPGTANMIDQARRADIEVVVIE